MKNILLKSATELLLKLVFHVDYSIGEQKQNAIFLDFNIAQLRYEQFFTVGIDDPLNQSPEPLRFEQVPIFGEEKPILLKPRCSTKPLR